MPLTKSSELTSGLTFSRITSPAMVGVKFSRMPNSLNTTVTGAGSALTRPESGTRRRRESSLPGRCRRSGSARRGSERRRSTRSAFSTPPIPCVAIEEEEVQEVAEDQLGVGCSSRRKSARRTAASSTARAQSCRSAIRLTGPPAVSILAIHFGEPDLQHHLLALAAARHLQQVDELRLRHRGGRNLRRMRSMILVFETRPDRIVAPSFVPTVTSSPGNSDVQLLFEVRDRLLDDDVVLHARGRSPDDEADRAGRFLPSIRISRGCDDDGVGDVGIRDRDARHVEVGRRARSNGRR